MKQVILLPDCYPPAQSQLVTEIARILSIMSARKIIIFAGDASI